MGRLSIRGGMVSSMKLGPWKTFEGQFGMQNKQLNRAERCTLQQPRSVAGLLALVLVRSIDQFCPFLGGERLDSRPPSLLPASSAGIPLLASCPSGQTTVFPESTSARNAEMALQVPRLPCEIFGVDPISEASLRFLNYKHRRDATTFARTCRSSRICLANRGHRS